jgi:trans-aconitate 2-methyltransferase
MAAYFKMLNPGGLIAMQIPNPSTMPIMHAITKTAAENKWKLIFEGFNNGLYLYEPGIYYDILCKHSGDINVWETHYHHIMPNHESIIEWYSSTGMKPYLDLLDEDGKEEFAADVLSQIKLSYPAQADGTVLFPFRRILFTAKK